MNTAFTTVDDYISSFPEEIQIILKQLRQIILEEAQDVKESISYGMPAYKTHGKPLVYFAAFKKHIGFYATPNTHEAFASKLHDYKQGKGSVQFPLGKPIPYQLIREMVLYKMKTNSET